MNTRLKEIVKKSHSKSDVVRELGLKVNGSNLRKIEKLIQGLDYSHFDRYHTSKLKIKYPVIEKSCPICGKSFETQKGHKKEKTTCSKSCSNTFFKSGDNNPNFIDGNGGEATYRRICFKHHEKKCIVCDEKNIVEVHHYDEDHNNNSPENLIPLCPTHHKYWHSRFRTLIKRRIDKYIGEWKSKNRDIA